MAIQGTQVPIYTNTHCFCIFLILQFFIFYFYVKQNKTKLKTNKQKHVNIQSIKLDANAWERRRKRRDHFIEITPMFWRKNSKRLLSRGLVNKLAFSSLVWMKDYYLNWKNPDPLRIFLKNPNPTLFFNQAGLGSGWARYLLVRQKLLSLLMVTRCPKTEYPLLETKDDFEKFNF